LLPEEHNLTNYPLNTKEWIRWIKNNLDIDELAAIDFLEEGAFPFYRLEALWKREFSVNKGYHSDFVPALVRNKRGLIAWVYRDSSEPNWRMDDTFNLDDTRNDSA